MYNTHATISDGKMRLHTNPHDGSRCLISCKLWDDRSAAARTNHAFNQVMPNRMQPSKASRHSIASDAVSTVPRGGHDGRRRHETAKRGSRMFCVRQRLESVAHPRNRLTTGVTVYWQRHSDYRVSGVANAGNVDASMLDPVTSVYRRVTDVELLQYCTASVHCWRRPDGVPCLICRMRHHVWHV